MKISVRFSSRDIMCLIIRTHDDDDDCLVRGLNKSVCVIIT